MKARFLPPALKELLGYATWYDDKKSGLGDRFLDTIQRTLAADQQFPNGQPPIDAHYRKILTPIFPFALIYRIDRDTDTLIVVAVAHLSRKPDYWRRRDTGP
jgi:toxin ParE1/3/4